MEDKFDIIINNMKLFRGDIKEMIYGLKEEVQSFKEEAKESIEKVHEEIKGLNQKIEDEKICNIRQDSRHEKIENSLSGLWKRVNVFRDALNSRIKKLEDGITEKSKKTVVSKIAIIWGGIVLICISLFNFYLPKILSSISP